MLNMGFWLWFWYAEAKAIAVYIGKRKHKNDSQFDESSTIVTTAFGCALCTQLEQYNTAELSRAEAEPLNIAHIHCCYECHYC